MLRRFLTLIVAVAAFLAAAWPVVAVAQPTASTVGPSVGPFRERIYFVKAKLVRTMVVKSGERNVALLALEETGPASVPVPREFEVLRDKERGCRTIYFLHEAADGDAEALARSVGTVIDGVALPERAICTGSPRNWVPVAARPTFSATC